MLQETSMHKIINIIYKINTINIKVFIALLFANNRPSLGVSRAFEFKYHSIQSFPRRFVVILIYVRHTFYFKA